MVTQVQQRKMNILLAYDGSKHAQAAADLVRSLPLPHHSSLYLLGVLSPRESSNHAILEASLEHMTSSIQSPELAVESEVTVGDPAETILNYTEKLDPDLLVVGAKGLRATLGILLGGVAQQIIEYASLPVLVVRAPFKQLKKLLLVTDGSRCSAAAIDYLAGKISPEGVFLGEQFPLPLSVEVDVLHVLPPAPSADLLARNWPMGPELIPTTTFDIAYENSFLEEEQAAGQALVDKLVLRLEMSGIPATGVLLRGDAATEIIEYAKAHQIDLVVAGSRGLSAVKSWWLGSVSRKLVHYAGCSVLIVKGLPHCAKPQEPEDMS
jgi:nucleotide-binding universal stress UspA family protein